MGQISNYDSSESLAAGFVRPKVTALFFDKIWVPSSLLRTSYEFFIPEQVLIQEDKELTVKVPWTKRQRKRAGNLYSLSMLHNNRLQEDDGCIDSILPIALSGEFYKRSVTWNTPVVLTEPMVESIPNETHDKEYKYSKHRNYAIMVNCEEFYRKYGLHISPVYHCLTDFERDLKSFSYEDINRNKSLKYKYKRPNTTMNRDAIAITIQNFPGMIEDELSWEQVLEIRKDKKRAQQIKRFSEWTKRELTGKSPAEINDIFEHELKEYKDALKVHGIKTAISSFSTIISAYSSIASIINAPNMPILPLLSVASLSLSFGADCFFSNMQFKNNPIAFLYDIEENNL